MIFLILFLSITSFCFAHINIEAGQIFKDMYFNCGCASLLIALMFLRKAKLKLSMLIAALLYIGYSTYYLVINNSGWGPDYRNYLICKYVFRLILVLYFAMAADSRSFSQFKKNNWVMLGIGAIAFSFALIVGQGYLLPVLAIAVAVYITPMSKESWLKFVDALAVSMYVAFAVIMTQSLITAPDVYESGRYMGLFNFPVAGGLPAAMALMAGVYLFEKYCEKLKAKWLRIVVIVVIAAYPTIALFMIANRVSILSVMIAGVFAFIFFAKTDREKKAKKRGLIIATVLLFLMVISVLVLKLLISNGSSQIDEYIASKGDNAPGVYYLYMIRNVACGETRTGVFMDGTVKNAIDRLSSERFSITYMGVRQIKLWGNSARDVTLPNGDYFAHTHNTYLDWLLRLGWIGGGFMIAWFFSIWVAAGKRIVKNDKAFIFIFLWISFCAPFFFLECESVIHMTFFWLLILQYPLFMELKSKASD